MGKGKIAHYEQFILLLQCFQKACFPEVSKLVVVWEWVNSFPNDKFHSSKLKDFTDNNFTFDENGRNFFYRNETLLEKGKLLVTSKFSFSHHFSRDLHGRHVKIRACLGRVNCIQTADLSDALVKHKCDFIWIVLIEIRLYRMWGLISDLHCPNMVKFL